MRNDDWFEDAACRGSYSLKFFGSKDQQDEVRVLYCVDCPVRAECLSLAVRIGEKQGLWGGRKRSVRSVGK